MNAAYYQYLCQSLAKSTLTGIRLYENKELLYYYSAYHIHPDPVKPFLDRILNSPHEAGVYTTPLYQFYGYLTLSDGYTIILGPSRIANEDRKLIEELLFLLEVPPERQKEYEHLLFCAPAITADRMSWTVSYLLSSATDQIFPAEQVYIDTEAQDFYPESSSPESAAVAGRTAKTGGKTFPGTSANVSGTAMDANSTGTNSASLHSLSPTMQDFSDMHEPAQPEFSEHPFRLEQLLMSFIEAGQPQNLEELYSAAPSVPLGAMADDSLRQRKNAGICCAAVTSRAAIAGGMDSQTAFRISDLYIQKFELLRDIYTAEKLMWEMMIDYAKRVQQIHYNTKEDSALFHLCAAYVSQNIYNIIRTEDLAKETGYTRTYLCNQFRKQTGITLTHYILQEKIIEAKRMLQFTDKSLSEIAALFSFSSQSHFQTVFKKITGETPLAYRQRVM